MCVEDDLFRVQLYKDSETNHINKPRKEFIRTGGRGEEKIPERKEKQSRDEEAWGGIGIEQNSGFW